MASAEVLEIKQGLSGLARSISNNMERVNTSTASFRETANQNHRALSGIVKDLYSSISAQRRQINQTNAGIEGGLDRVSQGVRETASVADATNNTMQQVLSVQYKTLSELSTLNRNFNYLLNNTSGTSLTTAFGSALTNSLGDSWLGKLSGAMKIALGVGGVAAVGGGVAMMSGIGSGQQISNPVMANDIYNYLTKEKGVDHNHAVGMLANIQNESKFSSGAIGDNGTSGGLFQHHNERFAAMQNAAGPQWQKNWKGQIDYAMTEGEMKKHLATPVSSGQEAASQFVYTFEKPKDKAGEAASRAGNVAHVEKILKAPVSSTTNNQNVTNVNTTNLTPEQADAKRKSVSSDAPNIVTPKGYEKTEEKAVPKDDIVALGRYLKSQRGLNISEHPAFGGVSGATADKPWGIHSPTGGHGDGTAIDINYGSGIVEAKDPMIGPMFDKLAEQLRNSGYQVLWRVPGHEDHMHVRMTGPGSASNSAGMGSERSQIASQAGGMSGMLGASAEGSSLGSMNDLAKMYLGAYQNMMSPQGMMGALGLGSVSSMAGLANIVTGGASGMMSPINLIQKMFMSSAMTQPETAAAEQIEPQPQAAKEIQNVAIQEKVEQSAKVVKEETKKEQQEIAQNNVNRYVPQGSFSDYNSGDNNIYPEDKSWAELLGNVFGWAGNVKSTLAG